MRGIGQAALRRCCGAELLGTFAIVFFGCGAIATVGQGPVGHLTVNLVFGLVVGAMIMALGHLSGAHFNPAVTAAFAATGRCPWRCAAPYIAAQIGGAVAGSALHRLVIPEQAAAARYGATLPALPIGACLAVEIVLTFFLMLVIASVATDTRAKGPAGVPIGATVGFCGLLGGPLTGCSMNPARSLAPALFAGADALLHTWLYVLGPVCGAVAAARVYEALRGGPKYGQGVPPFHEDPLEEELAPVPPMRWDRPGRTGQPGATSEVRRQR